MQNTPSRRVARHRPSAIPKSDPQKPEPFGRMGMQSEDVGLAKANVQRTGRTPNRRKPTKNRVKVATPTTKAPAANSTKSKGLAQLLTPKGITETLKSVGSLRTSVKTWLQYLQQADQLLDTLFVTSTSLKETGVLDKLIKQKGKNLTTDDFTTILLALMNTPVGGQLLKSFGNSGTNSEETPPQE